MTQTIEQLQSRVAELAAEVERWKTISVCEACAELPAVAEYIEGMEKQLAIAEAQNARLREALIATRDDLELRMQLAEDDSLNISNSVLDQMLDAIDTPSSREALDKYVAEKVKEVEQNAALQYISDFGQCQQHMEDIEQLTWQRDLAVEVLKTAYEVATNHDDRLPFDWAVYCNMLWQAIKESENN